MTDADSSSLPPALAQRILKHATEAVAVTDADLRILWVNEAYTRITGYSLEEIRGRTPRVLRSGHHDEAFYNRITETLRTDGSWEGEIWRRRKNGEIFPAMLTLTAIRDKAGNITHMFDFFNDIGEFKTRQQRVEFLVSHDALTELPNRYLLKDRLESGLSRAARHKSMMALLFMDLDNLKTVNDNHGHLAGDALLRTVAERLRLTVRESDTVARVSGDEFVVLLEDMKREQDAMPVVRKIFDALRSPILYESELLICSASIGIACYPIHGEYAERLLVNADTAMYRAKRSGGDACCMWSADEIACALND